MSAIATLLYNPDYLPGALVLGHVLRKIAPINVKLVILIDTSEFSKWQLELLKELWDDLIETQISESLLRKKLEHDLKRPELAKTYTKIELWNLPYDKILYLDADVLPLEGQNPVTDLLKLDIPAGKIMAAPDSGFPDIFNSGVFVLTPNLQDYTNLLEIVTSNKNDVSFDGADQGLLNQYFNSEPDWVSRLLKAGITTVDGGSHFKDSNWIRIPFLYNTTPNTQYQYFPALNHFGYPGTAEIDQLDRYLGDLSLGSPGGGEISPYGNLALDHFSDNGSGSQVSVLHFIGASKPWNNPSSPTFTKWWLQWYEYSDGKLIETVLRLQKYPISVNPLNPPSSNVKQVHSPRDLCDPSNYQHLASKVGPNTQVWDATKNSPPLEMANPTSFGFSKKSYTNDWGEFIHQENVHKLHALGPSEVSEIFESKTITHKPKETSNQSPGFGVHQEQIAERVFDERSDYTPHHPLMMTDRKSLIETKTGVSTSDEEVVNPGNPVSSRKGDHSNSSGQKGELSTAEFKRLGPEVFPWERRQVQSERVWDEETFGP